MIKIVTKDSPILRKHAKPVSISEINTPKIKKILADMKVALDREDDGVAIAAPQIGVSLRIFIVSEKVFDGRHKDKQTVYINPEIVSASKEKKLLPEGCLSVSWLYGNTKRHAKVTIKAFDENGKEFVRGASGLLSHIFQHETDHLNGILFIDHAKDIEEIIPDYVQRETK